VVNVQSIFQSCFKLIFKIFIPRVSNQRIGQPRVRLVSEDRVKRWKFEPK